MTDEVLVALCDSQAVSEDVYFNDDKIAHGRAMLELLHKSGYTVVPLPPGPLPAKQHQHNTALYAGYGQAFHYCLHDDCGWREDYVSPPNHGAR